MTTIAATSSSLPHPSTTTTTTTSSNNVTRFPLLPADPVTDLDAILELALSSGMKDNEPFDSIFRHISHEDEAVFMRNAFTARVTRPGAETLKILDMENGGKMIAFFILQRPYIKTEEEEAHEHATISQPPPGTNMPLLAEFYRITAGIRLSNGFDPGKDFMGNMICTHNAYRRQGHAKRLLEAALSIADREGVTWYAACWPMSQGLYAKPELGFEYVTQEGFDMNLFGGRGGAVGGGDGKEGKEVREGGDEVVDVRIGGQKEEEEKREMLQEEDFIYMKLFVRRPRLRN